MKNPPLWLEPPEPSVEPAPAEPPPQPVAPVAAAAEPVPAEPTPAQPAAPIIAIPARIITPADADWLDYVRNLSDWQSLRPGL